MTSQREIAEGLGLPIHPPKIEIFDLAAETNTDPKGQVRRVDEYRLAPFGLYIARSIPHHRRLRYVESWLLPEQGLRISKWEFATGTAVGDECDQDYYLDIAGILPGANQWRSVDYYLDISVAHGRHAKLLDIDEFILAIQAELLDAATGQRAMETAHQAIDGLAQHRYDLPKWLGSKGIELSWSQ